MIHLHMRWDDAETGQSFAHKIAVDEAFAPVTVRDVDELVFCSFERAWAELVRVRTMAQVKEPLARTFPVRGAGDIPRTSFVPYDMILRHERRIMSSYGVSVPALALMGGLTFVQIVEVLEDWPAGCLGASEDEAREAVRKAVSLFRECEGPRSHLRGLS